MTAKDAINRPFVNAMFYEEPAGTFVDGYVFRTLPDLTSVQQDPDNGYWYCDIAHHESLTWSEKVYELFGLPAGTPIDRQSTLAHYSERSRSALETCSNLRTQKGFGFYPRRGDYSRRDGHPLDQSAGSSHIGGR